MDQGTLGLLIGLGLFAVAISAKLALDRWRPVPKHQEPQADASGLDLQGVAQMITGVVGCLVFLVAALLGLFVLVWIVKRMWEVA